MCDSATQCMKYLPYYDLIILNVLLSIFVVWRHISILENIQINWDCFKTHHPALMCICSDGKRVLFFVEVWKRSFKSLNLKTLYSLLFTIKRCILELPISSVHYLCYKWWPPLDVPSCISSPISSLCFCLAPSSISSHSHSPGQCLPGAEEGPRNGEGHY